MTKRKNPEDFLPNGRPTGYKKEYDELVLNYCLLGATDKQLCEFLGICEPTLNSWKKLFPSFMKSIKAGREEADANVAKALYNRAKGYVAKETKVFAHEGQVRDKIDIDVHYPPDTRAIHMWLLNRRPKEWRDRQEVEHTGKVTLESLLNGIKE